MTEWKNADVELPATDEEVICLISGIYEKIRYQEAYIIGSYDKKEEGWLFTTVKGLAFSEEIKELTIHCWTELPEVPGEFQTRLKGEKDG